MKAYFALLKCRLSVLFQYRAAALAGLTTQVFWGVVKVMIITAFYEMSPHNQPLLLSEAIVFIWLGQALLQLIPWNIDKEIEAQVRNGNVAYELVRPLDLYGMWYARTLALRLGPTIIRSVPLFIIAGLFFGLTAPISIPAAVCFAISVIFGALLSAAITTLVMISLFWTISGEGLVRLLPHFVVLFSGMVVPLPLFPDWMQPFLNVQPLRGIIDIPCRLYTGIIPAHEAPYYFMFQLLWTLAFIGLGGHLLKRALRSIIIQGG